jgi:L-serine deaminase
MSTQSRYGNTKVNREYLTTPVTIPIDYTSDLSGSFTTFSMVDKNYVDNQISIITGSDIDQIIGTNGISGGGTSGVITLLLGGTLSQSTTINA